MCALHTQFWARPKASCDNDHGLKSYQGAKPNEPKVKQEVSEVKKLLERRKARKQRGVKKER